MSQNAFGAVLTVTREFRSDGTESLVGGNPIAMDSEMTYSVSGSQLVEKVTRMSIGGKSLNVGMPMNGQTGRTESFTVNGNNLTITSSGNGIQTTQVYTRVQQQ